MTARPTVAVVVCAYTDKRWEEVLAAHASVVAQSALPDELVLVIDHNPLLMAKLRKALPNARIIPNTGVRGLSGARNTGIASTTSDLVLFLDDDAWADVDWVHFMVEPLADADVVGVAGRAVPTWAPPGRPAWFPESFLWVVGCSYEGQPTERAEIRNPLGCAMAFRRSALDLVGGFSGTVGRVGTHPVGCEETELAIRVRQAKPASRVILEPAALVHHHVPASRLRFSYFVERCFWEGVSKAVVAKSVGAEQALSAERRYTLRVLPGAFGRGVLDLVHGRPAGILRSGAVLAGLVVTATGYLRGRISGTTTPRSGAKNLESVA